MLTSGALWALYFKPNGIYVEGNDFMFVVFRSSH